MSSNPMLAFQEEAPEAAAAFNGLIESLCARKDGMDAKTRQLAYLAMKASQSDTGAVSCLAPALEAYDATPTARGKEMLA
jgi:alkylhydroperoxidase/carboxymuconolactone decarboxylase family protein YurZ